MAAAAILRSAARSLRLRRPLEQRRVISEGRFLGSSAPSSETRKCFPSSDPRSRPRVSMKRQSRVICKEQEIYQHISATIDRISDRVERCSRLLDEIEEIEARRAAADITPWVVSLSTAASLVALYAYFKG
ncbi:hypothetical protein BS78_K202400 [Paspalum vaginatum]|uniref:Uncharacterized protein n=1 Tax=Paspalum vaginatum TaxID=158149 RepID=A0A9W7XAF4_9POAL|nr:hypothetical protein BS78_K202400 [Paspalum vaginatum]